MANTTPLPIIGQEPVTVTPLETLATGPVRLDDGEAASLAEQVAVAIGELETAFGHLEIGVAAEQHAQTRRGMVLDASVTWSFAARKAIADLMAIFRGKLEELG